MSSPVPPQARSVSVGFARVARWLDGFTERHGPTQAHCADGVTVELRGADGARAWLEVPFGPLATESRPAADLGVTPLADPVAAMRAHVALPRTVAVLLVRRAGYAAGLFEDDRLIASKVDSTYVQGTTKAGGWSQQRYARRRANQADAAFAHAADGAVRVLGEVRPDALVAGGDRDAVRAVLVDRRLAHLPAPSGPWLTVKDPKLKVLAAMPEQFRAVRIHLHP